MECSQVNRCLRMFMRANGCLRKFTCEQMNTHMIKAPDNGVLFFLCSFVQACLRVFMLMNTHMIKAPDNGMFIRANGCSFVHL